MSKTKSNQPIVTRLAPTPSGYLHIGNIFAFLVAWLDARQANGSVILRIEDLDKPRCKEHLIDTMIRDLDRLGLCWDNETIMRQSQRTNAYVEALDALRDTGMLYPCFCSRADLMAASAPHEGEHLVYAGTCKSIPQDIRTARASQESHSIRLAVPEAIVRFRDDYQGQFHQSLREECGDFIVRRRDGLFAYQLAVVVDDIEQGVNRIVRGVDLLSSTPQQMYLRSLLTRPDCENEASEVPRGKDASSLIAGQFNQVSFGHTPLIKDAEGNRLAKRRGSKGLESLLETFKSVEALLGYLAFATGLITENSPITAEELIREADLNAIKGKTEVRLSLDDQPNVLRANVQA